MNRELNNFLEVSKKIGEMPDLIQGSGGNTSLKLDPIKMMIKASGYQLQDMSSTDGYTVVNHDDIHKYFLKNSDKEENLDLLESGSTEYIRRKVISKNKYPNLRPSMETGFHAVLDNVVIHTHSVYSNLVNCAINGDKLLNEIFTSKDNVNIVYVPFYTPGFELSSKILKLKLDYLEQFKKTPNVYFLENHGLITTGKTVDETFNLDKQINNSLKSFFRLNKYDYPKPKLERIEDKTFKSGCTELKRMMFQNEIDLHYFERVLFPDQVVFFSGNISINGSNSLKKINIDTNRETITYNTNEKEAKIIEETFLAYLFIEQNLKSRNQDIRYLADKHISYIDNMESESYRRSLL